MMHARSLKTLIGTNVKMLRERRGLSQEQLAVAIDRTWQSISHIETGKSLPPLTTLAALASALGVGTGDLLMERTQSTGHREDLSRQIQTMLAEFDDKQMEAAAKLLTVLRDALRTT